MGEASAPRRVPVYWLLAFVLVGVASGAVAGAVTSLLLDGSEGVPAAQNGPATERRVLVEEESAVSEAVAVVLPSVVTVLNEQAPRVDESGQLVSTVAVGTGVIIDERGYVVTNQHVISNAETLSIVLENGQTRPAELVSDDAPFTDLAVLRVQPGGLQPARWGDSDALVLGQKVAAIGSALFDYSGSVSQGIVSGLERRWLREGIYLEDLIQTDAALNAGNSGGPLINLKGEVIGISTNVVRKLGSIENVYGISFAQSSNAVAPIVQAIIETGSYPRPYFGVDHLDIDEVVATERQLPTSFGALVLRVVGGSPAEAAGIEIGDIIVKVGDTELSDSFLLLNALSRLEPDAVTTIEVLRPGGLQELPIELRPR